MGSMSYPPPAGKASLLAHCCAVMPIILFFKYTSNPTVLSENQIIRHRGMTLHRHQDTMMADMRSRLLARSRTMMIAAAAAAAS